MYIAFDCESGGIDPTKSSLLTVYFAILNDNLEQVDELYLKLKPEGKHYCVTPEALSINKLDLVKLDAEGIHWSAAIEQLTAFLEVHSNKGKDKLTPLGHNIAFDIAFLTTLFYKKSRWEYYVSYRNICTAGIMRFLGIAGILPKEVTGGLKSAAEYFKLSYEGAHDAKFDTLLTIEVFKKLVNITRYSPSDLDGEHVQNYL